MSQKQVRRLWIQASALVLLGAGAFFAYRQWGQPAAAEDEPALQTARVRTGDLVITASGAGTLMPSVELELGFRSAGVLTELLAVVGERVEAGAVLARLDDRALQLQLQQAELNLATAELALARLTGPAAIADAQLAVVTKQAAFDDAQDALTSLNQPNVDYYAAALDDAQRAYDTAVANAQLVTTGSRSPEQAVANAEYAVELAEGKLNDAIRWYGEGSEKAVAAQATLALARADLEAARLALQVATSNQEKTVTDAAAALETAHANYAYVTDYQPPSADVALAQAQVQVAQSDLAEAEAWLAELRGEALPDGASSTLDSARAQVAQATLAIESARLALDNAVLIAPVAGTITAVSASVGEAVGTGAIVSLAALDEPLVRFFVEESDLGKLAVGYPVQVTFEAAPDLPVSGAVLRIDPALVSVDGSPAVQAWASLDAPEGVLTLVSGLTAEVEIVAGEAKGALLVPIQALRELTPGSYAVFVVQADGELKLTPVTVGLKDFANAEILSGLQAGDVVSTGTIETK